jgi:hypothetical protein
MSDFFNYAHCKEADFNKKFRQCQSANCKSERISKQDIGPYYSITKDKQK